MKRLKRYPVARARIVHQDPTQELDDNDKNDEGEDGKAHEEA